MSSWNVYKFDRDPMLESRLRRLERGTQYLRAGAYVKGSGSYARIPSDLLDGKRISIASPHLALTGSVPPSGVTGNFGFSATTTSITVYWDGTNSSVLMGIVRADSSVVDIPAGSLTINGLSSGTTYGFLPFRSVYNSCGIGWVIGDSGSPQFAFSPAGQTTYNVALQGLQGREQLSQGYMTYATTSGGSSSGTGGGGGIPGKCVMLGTDIEPVGDNDYSTIHHQNFEWIRIESSYPRSLNCTPDHPLYHADKGKIKAEDFKARGGDLSDWIVTDQGEHRITAVTPFKRVCVKQEVVMPTGHLFWANGYLSHNVKYFGL